MDSTVLVMRPHAASFTLHSHFAIPPNPVAEDTPLLYPAYSLSIDSTLRLGSVIGTATLYSSLKLAMQRSVLQCPAKIT